MKSLFRFLPSLLFVGSLLTAAAPTARADGFTFSLGEATLLPNASQQVVEAFYPEAVLGGLGTQLAAELQLQLTPQVAALAAQVRDEVDNLLTPLNFSTFLHNSANASALAAKAMPVDYATGFQLFSLSAGGGAAIGGTQYLNELRHPNQTIDNLSNSIPPHVGIAPDLAVSLGINLGAFKVPKWRYFDLHQLQVFVSAFTLPLGQDTGTWSAKTSTFGGYLKYRILRDRVLGSKYLFHWHGLNVLSGVGYSATKLKVNVTLPNSSVSQAITVENQTLNINAAWTGDAKVGADMHVYTIPFEVTSALQLLYAVTLYGGAAVDFNVGQANLMASANAPVAVTATQPGNSQQVLLSQPTPALTYDLHRKATTVDVRGFAGLQINAGVLALFAQVSGDTNHSAGVHAGLRGFW